MSVIKVIVMVTLNTKVANAKEKRMLIVNPLHSTNETNLTKTKFFSLWAKRKLPCHLPTIQNNDVQFSNNVNYNLPTCKRRNTIFSKVFSMEMKNLLGWIWNWWCGDLSVSL